ncbi:MAG: CoA-binding protein [Candidatus Thorarchaeota archaeon]
MTSSIPSDLNVKNISFINNIKSMAVIGPSEKRNFFFLKNHQESFKGKLYAVHPKVKDIPNFPKENVYNSIKDIPEDLDFAFIAVPAKNVPKVIDECVEKKVKLVSIFSAEFSDSGTKEGIELEKDVVKRAGNKLRILGPNGMGLFYPKLGIAWRSRFPTAGGNIGFIAQSGGICNIAIYSAKEYGINFSKVFSFGNGADLDLVDLLYFLSNDPETDLILSYVEGIKEHRGLDLKRVLYQNRKPVVILKGGKSNKGKLAAKTHTASISGKNKIWESLFKQFNLIEVESLEQLLNTARLINFYDFHEINNVAVFSISGGYGVVLVDLIEKFGMTIPDFSPEIQSRLNDAIFIRGTSAKNPLDVAAQLTYSKSIKEIISLALSDKKIDALIMDFPSWYFSYEFFITKEQDYEKSILEALSLGHKYNKPLIPIIQRASTPDEQSRISRLLAEKKVPVFGDPLEVIPLLKKVSEYKKKLKE